MTLDLYQQAVTFVLKNDPVKTVSLIDRFNENSTFRKLVETRILILQKRYAMAVDKLSDIDIKSEKCLVARADYDFLLGRLNHFLGRPSKQNFLRSFRNYKKLGNLGQMIRSLMNSVVEDMETGNFIWPSQAIKLAEDILKQSNDSDVYASVIKNKARLFILKGEYAKAVDEILDFHKKTMDWNIRPRKVGAVIWLYLLDGLLNLGRLQETKSHCKHLSLFVGEEDINETVKFLYWRYQCQIEGRINKTINFTPKKCLNTFTARAKFFSDAAKGLPAKKNSDVEFIAWKKSPPPELRWINTELQWEKRLGQVRDSMGLVVLQTRIGSRTYLLIELLAIKGHTTWELSQKIYGKIASQQKVFNLISRVNRKAPGLVYRENGRYFLNCIGY